MRVRQGRTNVLSRVAGTQQVLGQSSASYYSLNSASAPALLYPSRTQSPSYAWCAIASLACSSRHTPCTSWSPHPINRAGTPQLLRPCPSREPHSGHCPHPSPPIRDHPTLQAQPHPEFPQAPQTQEPLSSLNSAPSRARRNLVLFSNILPGDITCP